MTAGAIYYLVDDIFYPKLEPISLLKSVRRRELKGYINAVRNGNPRPVGGTKVHYQHCMVLRKAGFNAIPVLLGRYEGNYFGYDINPISVRDLGYRLNKNDIVVSTEFRPYEGLKFSGCRRIIFVQNWINILRRLKQKDLLRNYLLMGYDDVITCSDYNTNEVFKYMGIRATTLKNGVDTTTFFESSSQRIPNRIMCLPRKNPKDLERIKSLVSAKNSLAEFYLVDKVDQRTMAEEYRKSDIFLATGYPEGFALPPLEAMHSGCAVVGFTGQAGNEYMIDGVTALTSPDGDCAAASANLTRILSDARLKEKIREGGKNIASEYTEETMAAAVVNYFERYF